MRMKNWKKLFHYVLIILLMFSMSNYAFVPATSAEVLKVQEGNGSNVPENTLRIHYQREDGNYENLGLWLWDDVEMPSQNWPGGGTPFVAEQVDDYGVYLDIPIKYNAKKVGFLVLNVVTGDKDGGDKTVELIHPDLNEVWISQGSDEVNIIEPVDLPENTIRIHYDREDNNYDDWAIWTWGDVASPSTGGWPDGATNLTGVGKHGAYYDIPLTEEAQDIGFLFVNKATGVQTGDYNYTLPGDEYNQFFVKDGDNQVYPNPYGSIPTTLISGELLSDSKIQLLFSKTEDLTVEALINELAVTDKDGNPVDVEDAAIINDTKVEIYGSFALDAAPFYITYDGMTIPAAGGWRMVDEMYGYDGELGAELHADGTATLKVWSPKADNVSVVLYDKDNQMEVVQEDIPMTLGDRGVWEVTLNQENTGLNSVKGYYYHYKITHGEETNLALDPYAKSLAGWKNPELGGEYPIAKAAIVDPSNIGPALDFATIDGYEKREDAIIYEVHVRDFTSDPSIEDELNAQFGTFSAFIDKLDYIQSLGVTHIQLMPVMSYFFGDEWQSNERLLEYSSSDNNYNWGYDPQSYFSLSGMYSENPDNPELRIAEFKNLVNEIHKRGMGVVLDVVYNHTARTEIFENLVPNYYHFMDVNGNPKENFGGGRLGTTHKMSRRVLVDSIKYWTEEYKIDGFRFDMMGDHDAESIQLAYDEASKINPNVLMIGEGWITYSGDDNDPVMAADQSWMQYTNGVASFSDEIRNELKSGFGSEGQPRFITNGARNINTIFSNIKGQPTNFLADDPGDVVQYIAAHDNLTLHDVIAQSIKKDPEYYEEEIHKRIRIGNSLILTSQGTPFIHAGQEYGRTKQYRAETDVPPNSSTYMTDENGNPFVYPYFIHDSYDSSDAINMIDWEKATNEEAYPINNLTREYTTGLIELRRSTDAFRLGEKDLVDSNVTLVSAPEMGAEDLIIAYRNEATNGDAYYVFINADDEERSLTLNEDLTNGVVLVDNDEAGVEEVTDLSGVSLSDANITLDPLTTAVVKVSANNETPSEPGDGDDDGDNPTNPGDGDDNGENPTNPGNGDENGDNPTVPGDSTNPSNPTDGNGGDNGTSDEAAGAPLPNTATMNYQWLLIGTVLLIGAIAMYVLQRKRYSVK
ncbi:pullulanase [Caldibacillus lycopersici]|uniref:pullulanase n=1 Tax=Perspicuibacillus lycopersici TaxID=1325689 RepID=A0AAE3LND7_9BACI|nr:pullulanase [Perspicuibacillus lycopersici]MCU9614590.1 pullulanase [Perspicuibacillus lycopersici]